MTLEYDGTRYAGWQRQKCESTIQAEIEHVLSLVTRQSVTVAGSGRTDAGVHALGQVASFRCRTRLSPESLQRAMNSLLPEDIVVRDCCEADDDFHARFAAVSKTYHYFLRNHPVPSAIERNHCWHIQKPLDMAAMRQAIGCLVGTFDFSAFEGAGSPRAHSIRTLYRAHIEDHGDGRWAIIVEGNGFLRHMVRNIVGTLVRIGMGKMPADQMLRILASADRRQAGATAPARGLFLMEVRYSDFIRDVNTPVPLEAVHHTIPKTDCC